jgi:hypothetical protein
MLVRFCANVVTSRFDKTAGILYAKLVELIKFDVEFGPGIVDFENAGELPNLLS